MPTAVRVEAAVPGRRRSGTAERQVDIDLAPGPATLRELITAVVRAEVAAFRERAEQRSFIRVLTEKALVDGMAAGVVRSGGEDRATHVDTDEAVATALLAHDDGLYQVLVDDEPVGDLDTMMIDLRADTRLLFLRLVPLAGG